MAIENINNGDFPNDPTGDVLREGAFKINRNFNRVNDNIDIFKGFRYPSNAVNITTAQILAWINSIPAYTVNEKQSVWFSGTQYTNDSNGFPMPTGNSLLYKMVNIGIGNYGLGQTQLTSNNIRLVTRQRVSVEDEIGALDSTQRIPYLLMDGETLSEWLNSQNPPIVIQDQEDGYVLFQGAQGSYIFTDDGGTYGFGALQSTDESFEMLSNDLPSPTPSLEDVSEVNNIVNNIPHIFKSGLQQLILGSYGVDYTNGGVSATSIGFRDPVIGGKIFVPDGRNGDDILTTRDLAGIGVLNHGEIRKKGKGYKQDIDGTFINNTGAFTLNEPGDAFEAFVEGYMYPFLRYNGDVTTEPITNLDDMVWEFRYKATLPGEPGYESPE